MEVLAGLGLFLFTSYVGLILFGLFVATVFIFFVETESPFWATGFAILVAVFMQLFSPIPIISLAIEHPFHTLAYFVGYLAAGTAWGIGKWWFYLGNVKTKYNRAVKLYNASTTKDWKNFNDFIIEEGLNTYELDSETYRPLIAKNKRRFMIWMVYWPFSMVWTLLNDPIRKIFNWIYDRLAGMLQGMSDKMFNDVEKPIEYVKPEKNMTANGANFTKASHTKVEFV